MMNIRNLIDLKVRVFSHKCQDINILQDKAIRVVYIQTNWMTREEIVKETTTIYIILMGNITFFKGEEQMLLILKKCDI